MLAAQCGNVGEQARGPIVLGRECRIATGNEKLCANIPRGLR
jgi:hypothetical protein